MHSLKNASNYRLPCVWVSLLDSQKSFSHFVILSGIHLVVQVLIWGLTLKFGKIKAPVVSLVLRDGSLVFAAMLGTVFDDPSSENP